MRFYSIPSPTLMLRSGFSSRSKPARHSASPFGDSKANTKYESLLHVSLRLLHFSVVTAIIQTMAFHEYQTIGRRSTVFSESSNVTRGEPELTPRRHQGSGLFVPASRVRGGPGHSEGRRQRGGRGCSNGCGAKRGGGGSWLPS
jgi:hypothetical protein